MANDSKIVFKTNRVDENLTLSKLLAVLKNSGWDYINQDQVNYMIMVHSEPEWYLENKSNNYIDIITNKVDLGELVALQLFHSDVSLNCMLYINERFGEITFWLTTERNLISETSITDFSHFLNAIVSVIGRLNMSIYMIECIDFL